MKARLLGAFVALALSSFAQAGTVITALPTPPSRNDPSNFSNRADAFLGSLPLFATQTNAVAGEINTSAAAAAASAATAVNAPGTSATSSTSLAIGTGSKSLTIQTGKLFVVGQFVLIASSSAPSAFMNGQITAYNSGTGALTVNAGYAQGSGTYASWSVALSTPVDASQFVPKAGGIFTGTVTAPTVAIDSGLYLGLSGGNPLLSFDAVDGLTYNRASNRFAVNIGGSQQFYVDPTGATLSGALAAGAGAFSGALTAPNLTTTGDIAIGGTANITGNVLVGSSGIGYARLKPGDSSHTGSVSFLQANGVELGYIGYSTFGSVLAFGSANGFAFTGGTLSTAGLDSSGPIRRDSAFFIEMGSGGPYINFGSGSYEIFDRTAQKFTWVINGVAVMSLDASGNLKTKGSLTQNTTP